VVEGSFNDTKRQSFTNQDFRFTVGQDGSLYAICLGWPVTPINIKSLGIASIPAGTISGINLLGSDAKLEWTQDAEGLHIQPPTQKPCEHAFTFKISFKG